MPQIATKTSFVKGKSGNPKGKPPMPQEMRDQVALARQRLKDFLPQAFDVLQQMFDSEIEDKNGRKSPNLATREQAMHIVLNRNLGMVVERKEISGVDGGAIRIEDNTPSIKILLQSALGPLIEGEKE